MDLYVHCHNNDCSMEAMYENIQSKIFRLIDMATGVAESLTTMKGLEP